ncbi:peroxisomal targeting signal 1 receptor-like [Amphibalanus amphitrite]|uniref:peroxisomal targeting signal 1 receptor-like n=1 Tax=Amphibalanus amphitrite TaxID=1232801 RepID=UPI001C8FCFEB|nr:peroxisomal targeting signal 1 receptor-like [Amphibalanus amphitrite]
MAMRDLLDGECGGPNAVVKLTSHLTRDRSHREDALRHLAPAPGAAGLTAASDDQVVQEFLREAARPETRGPTSFRMGSLLQELREIERGGAGRPVTAPNVALLAAAEPAVWAEQFAAAQRQQEGDAQTWPDEVGAVGGPLPTPDQLAGPGIAPPVPWTADLAPVRPLPRPPENPLDEVQWVDQYRPSEDAELQRTADQILGSVDDPTFSGSEFMNFLAKIRDGEVEVPEPATAAAATAEAGGDPAAAVAEAAAAAAAEAEPEVDSAGMTPRAREEFWARLEREWADLYKSDEHPWLSDYTDHFSLQEYQFDTDNRFRDDPDPLAEGQRRLAAGDLPGAVLCFEAAAQREPESPLAWQLLGTSLAENEQDPAAITALRRCIELDPGCLRAYMALAASYTNESYPLQACAALREWLRHHSEYKHLVKVDTSATHPSAVFQPSLLGGDTHGAVQAEFLEAARLRPSDPDADVQCGLGVLLHMAGDYERAVDCFSAALSVQPENAQLWNKLGATLANGNKPEEAVSAYSRALQLSPGFIRARFNLGISCRSLNANREAVEHFLSALEHQASSRGVSGRRSDQVMSQSIWSMLRMTLAAIGRADLYAAVDSRDLATLSREFGTGTAAGSGSD